MNLSLSSLGAIQQQVYIRVDSLCLNWEALVELTWMCCLSLLSVHELRDVLRVHNFILVFVL